MLEQQSIYTVAEASRFLRVQEARLRKAIHDGELKAARIGRVFRIRESDLVAFFESSVSAPVDDQAQSGARRDNGAKE